MCWESKKEQRRDEAVDTEVQKAFLIERNAEQEIEKA